MSLVRASLVLMVAAALCGVGPGAPTAARESGQPAREPPDEILLAAVQMGADPAYYQSGKAFEREAERLLWELDERYGLDEDSLVVFPENVGLLSVIAGAPPSDSLYRALGGYLLRNPGCALRLPWLKATRRVSWNRALFLLRQEEMAESYFGVFSELAEQFGVYLVAGSGAFTPRTLAKHVPRGVPGSPQDEDEDRAVYNVSAVFNPQGEVIGIQKKSSLTEMEGPAGLDLTPGDSEELQAIPTPLGRLGIALCFDAFHREQLLVLEQEGTDILVQPSANPVPWEPWQQEEWLGGIHSAVREYDFVYGVNPMLVGDFFDYPFAGQSVIVAPPRLVSRIGEQEPLGYRDTGPQPGFLALKDDPLGQGVIAVRVPHPVRARSKKAE